MRLLYFRGEGHGFMSGVKEYIVLLEDDDDTPAIDHAAPGFILDGVWDIDLTGAQDTCVLPFENVLARIL